METCSVEDCDVPVMVKKHGLCQRHYHRFMSKGSTDDQRLNARGMCSVEGCGRPHQAKGLCENHWRQGRQKRVRKEMKPPRLCGYCGEPVDPTRQYRGPVSYCSRACKKKAYDSDGRGAAASLRAYYNTKYGLTLDEAAAMRETGCAICRSTGGVGRFGQLHIDHDHATGLVRGVLCSECNTGLGKFKDDPALLRRSIDYLNR